MTSHRFLIVLTLTACTQSDNTPIAVMQKLDNIAAVGYSYHAADGNRYVNGQTDIASIEPLDIDLPSTANWIAAVADGDDSFWAASLSDGSVKAFKVNSEGYIDVAITPASIGSSQPITLALNNGNLSLANVLVDGSPYTSPIVVDPVNGSRVYVANNGDLVLVVNDQQQRLPINALTYSRLLLDEQQRVLVLTKPTLRYDHQVLQSPHANAAAITLVQTYPEFKVISSIDIDEPDVIEGNPLIWKDLNNDGKREIITTISNISEGARLVIYNENGSIYANSSAIGQGYRWRHQVAIAPFQNDDQLDLVSIYTPHIGPVAEFFRLDDASMTSTRMPLNYSSHLSVSLNLDKSIAGDFDNDGRPEVLLINRNSRKELAAVSYSNNSVNIDWTLSLAGEVSSNIAAVTLQSGTIALGIGQGSSLRIWQP